MNHLEKMSKANIKMSSKKYQFFEYYVRILTLKLGDSPIQGTNARKVISEVYSYFVLQCTLFERKSKHNTDVTAWHGIHFLKNNLWHILVKGNYCVNYQNYQIKCFVPPRILETNTDASIFVYKFRPERTGFNMYV